MDPGVSLWGKLELQKQPAGFVSAVSAQGLYCHRYCASTLCAPTHSPYWKDYGVFLLSTGTWHYGSTKVSIYALHKAGKFLIPCIKVWETWMFTRGFLPLPFYFIFKYWSQADCKAELLRKQFREASEMCDSWSLQRLLHYKMCAQPSVKKWCMEDHLLVCLI